MSAVLTCKHSHSTFVAKVVSGYRVSQLNKAAALEPTWHDQSSAFYLEGSGMIMSLSCMCTHHHDRHAVNLRTCQIAFTSQHSQLLLQTNPGICTSQALQITSMTQSVFREVMEVSESFPTSPLKSNARLYSAATSCLQVGLLYPCISAS